MLHKIYQLGVFSVLRINKSMQSYLVKTDPTMNIKLTFFSRRYCARALNLVKYQNKEQMCKFVLINQAYLSSFLYG